MFSTIVRKCVCALRRESHTCRMAVSFCVFNSKYSPSLFVRTCFIHFIDCSALYCSIHLFSCCCNYVNKPSSSSSSSFTVTSISVNVTEQCWYLKRSAGRVDLLKSKLPVAYQLTMLCPLKCHEPCIVHCVDTEMAFHTAVYVVAEIQAQRVGRETTADCSTIQLHGPSTWGQ